MSVKPVSNQGKSESRPEPPKTTPAQSAANNAARDAATNQLKSMMSRNITKTEKPNLK